VSDRAELDLPDVTAPIETNDSRVSPTEVSVPSISDVDIFGDMSDFPDLPDIDEAAKAADDQILDWDVKQETAQEEDTSASQKQAGW